MPNPFEQTATKKVRPDGTLGRHREEVRKIYDFVSEHLYLGRPDMTLGGRRYNATLLYSLATALVGGNELVVGEPGLGKTTSAEYVSALCYGLPLSLVVGSEIHGSPEETTEKMIGRPDLGQLSQGWERIRWQHFVMLPSKILDEVNRLPESKQNLLLDGIDRGIWRYLNETVVSADGCGFFTANYPDKGTVSLTPPLADRFDVSVESKYMGANLASTIALYRNGARGGLEAPDLSRRISKLLDDRHVPYENRIASLNELSEEVKDRFRKTLGVGLSWPDVKAARSGIGKIPFDESADHFMRFLLAELSFSHELGQIRSNEEAKSGGHYERYLCGKVRSCASQRLANSAARYGRGLAFLEGAESVEARHLELVFPYAMAHRIHWKDGYLDERAGKHRATKDHLALFAAKQAAGEVAGRFKEQQAHLRQSLRLARETYEAPKPERVAAARKIRESGDHPLYQETVRDLLARGR